MKKGQPPHEHRVSALQKSHNHITHITRAVLVNEKWRMKNQSTNLPQANLTEYTLRPTNTPKSSGDKAFYLRKKKAPCGHRIHNKIFFTKVNALSRQCPAAQYGQHGSKPSPQRLGPFYLSG